MPGSSACSVLATCDDHRYMAYGLIIDIPRVLGRDKKCQNTTRLAHLAYLSAQGQVGS